MTLPVVLAWFNQHGSIWGVPLLLLKVRDTNLRGLGRGLGGLVGSIFGDHFFLTLGGLVG